MLTAGSPLDRRVASLCAVLADLRPRAAAEELQRIVSPLDLDRGRAKDEQIARDDRPRVTGQVRQPGIGTPARSVDPSLAQLAGNGNVVCVVRPGLDLR